MAIIQLWAYRVNTGQMLVQYNAEDYDDRVCNFCRDSATI